MRAIGYIKSLPIDSPRALEEFSLDQPVAGPRDLLVRVRAVSVNPVDAKLRKRKEGKPGAPVVLGFDAAGVVEAIGSDVRSFRIGDEVFYAGDISRSGSNSEWQVVDERIVGHKPKKLSFAEAAAVPLTALTAHEALFEQLAVTSGKSLLLIGGAGGVGSMAIQMAKNVGATVLATASRPESRAWALQLGAHHVVDHSQPLLPQITALGFSTVDRIFNVANTNSYWGQMAELIAPFGRICSIVESPEPVDLSLLMMKSATFSWELMFTRSLFQTNDMAEQHRILEGVAADLDSGRLRTTVTEVLEPISAANLQKAHALIESGKSRGKIVLSGW